MVEEIQIVGECDGATDAGQALEIALHLAQIAERPHVDHRLRLAGAYDDVERQRAGDARADRGVRETDRRVVRKIREEVGVGLDARERHDRQRDQPRRDDEDDAAVADVELRERRERAAEPAALAGGRRDAPVASFRHHDDQRRYQRHRQHEQERDADHRVEPERAHCLDRVQQEGRESDHGREPRNEHRQSRLSQRPEDGMLGAGGSLELEVIAGDDMGGVRAADHDQERWQHQGPERDRLAEPAHDAHRPRHADHDGEQRQDHAPAGTKGEEQHGHDMSARLAGVSTARSRRMSEALHLQMQGPVR